MPRNTVEIITQLNDRVSAGYKSMERNVNSSNSKITRSLDNVEKESAQTTEKLKSTGNAVKGLYAGIAAFIGGRFAKTIYDTSVNVEMSTQKITRSLKVATGSAEGAAREIAFLKEESSRLGLEFESVALSYSKLAAATKETSLTTAQTREIFLATAEAGSALGLSAQDMEGALNAMQQMVSKGTVQAEELRGQLGERIPGAFNLAAKAMGKTTQELGKMLEQGQITAADMLPKLAVELRNTFGPEAEAGARELAGQINAAKNAMFDIFENLLKGGFSDLLKDTWALATDALRDYNKELKALRGGEDLTIANTEKLAQKYRDLQTIQSDLVLAEQQRRERAGDPVKIIETIVSLEERRKKLVTDINAIAGGTQAQAFMAKTVTQQNEQIMGLTVVNSKLKEQGKIEEENERKRKSALGSKKVSAEAGIVFGPGSFAGEMMFLEQAERQKQLAAELNRDLSIESLDARQEEIAKLKLWYDEKAAILTAAGENTINLETVYQQRSASINEEFRQKELEAERFKASQMKAIQEQNTRSFLNNLQIAFSGSKRFTALQKGLAVTETIYSTYLSAQKMFEAGTKFPFPLNTVAPFALAGSAVAAGLGRVAQIKAAAKGADFVTSGPQLMLVGDNPGGREKVQVTPLSSPNTNGPSGTTINIGSINVNGGNAQEIGNTIEERLRQFAEIRREADVMML